MSDDFTIVIDTQEQLPYRFADSVTRKLKTGDYSIAGLESLITIERKTKSDAYRTIGTGRKRFIRELYRMQRMDYAAIVIECSMSDFLIPPTGRNYKASKHVLSPKAAINSLISWSLRFNIPVWFAGNRELAQTLVCRLLEKYHKYHSGHKPENSMICNESLDNTR